MAEATAVRGIGQVSLIIRVAGTSNAGQHSPRTVELLDLYPTLTELAGLPHYARNEGTTLTRLLDDPDDSGWNKPALSQVNGGRSVPTERYRYTEWEEGCSGRELYDHANDPNERTNLADDPRYAGAVELLRAMLPPEQVESLPSRSRYNADEDCLIPSSRCTTAPPAGTPAPGPGNGGGDGIAGLVACQTD